jgi:glutathione S-transferase
LSPTPQTEQRTLITIPISHFCEKARWALDRANLSYTEQPHIQIVHRIAARKASGGKTVPVLVSEEGVFADSTAILEYADREGSAERPLFPTDSELTGEVRRLEDHFDEGLGPHGRRWMYQQTLTRPDLVREYGLTGIPNWERRAFPLLWQGAKPAIRRILKINDESVARSLAHVETVFDEVGERLADGRRYLVGDRFTAADLSFAALSAAVLVPPGYGVRLPQPDVLPKQMASQVNEFRNHPAGAFALRLYDQERSNRDLLTPA